MSRFKEIMQSDAENVFINKDEFSDVHTIDGRKMTVQVDQNEQIERSKAVLNSTDLEGIYNNTLLIYVRAREYGSLPPVGKILNFDGKPYRILSATDEAGIYSLEIKAVRS